MRGPQCAFHYPCAFRGILDALPAKRFGYPPLYVIPLYFLVARVGSPSPKREMLEALSYTMPTVICL